MGLLREALGALEDGPDDEREQDLNRRLYRSIVAAQVRAAREETEQVSGVVPEGRNPPVASDEQRGAREHKIPDFYWAYIDHLASDPAAAARQFVVECKRLTTATRNWSYTRQYIEGGVMRFLSEAHGYGKAAPSGAMVGYLQALDADQALTEVNASATANNLPRLTLRTQRDGEPIELDHRLDRPFEQSPFLLMHLWSSRS
jgi:hypothetical protein